MALHEPRSDRARAGDAKLEINPKRSLLASSGREHSFLPELPVVLRLHGLSVLDHTYLSLISYTFPAPFLGTVSLIAVFFFCRPLCLSFLFTFWPFRLYRIGRSAPAVAVISFPFDFLVVYLFYYKLTHLT